MDIEPKSMLPMFSQWIRTDRSTPSDGIDDEFFDRLNVALANVGERGPIVPRVPNLYLYQHPQVVVALANVAHFFAGISDDFPIPQEFRAAAQGRIEPSMPMSFTSKLKRAALVSKYESKWPTIERDLRDGHSNGLNDAAKVGANGLWLELYALVWASERGKLRELPVMFSESLASAFQHLQGKQRT